MGYLHYKDYNGSVEYSEENQCLYGKVLGLKNSLIISIFTVTFILFTFFSCNQHTKNDGQEKKTHEIGFEKYVADTVCRLIEGKKAPVLEISLSVKYPVKYYDPAMLDSLQRLMMASATSGFKNDFQNPEKVLRHFINLKIKEYRSTEEEITASQEEMEEYIDYDEDTDSFSYAYTSKTDSVFNGSGVFCFSTTVYGYSGGAHGLETVKYTCVNLDNGTIISANDIFVEDYEEPLTSIILKKIAQMNRLSSPQELENNGYFVSDVKPNNNFHINRQGIVFSYDPYEIAAYAVGRTDVLIPYKEIAHLLLPESPVARFLNP